MNANGWVANDRRGNKYLTVHNLYSEREIKEIRKDVGYRRKKVHGVVATLWGELYETVRGSNLSLLTKRCVRCKTEFSNRCNYGGVCDPGIPCWISMKTQCPKSKNGWCKFETRVISNLVHVIPRGAPYWVVPNPPNKYERTHRAKSNPREIIRLLLLGWTFGSNTSTELIIADWTFDCEEGEEEEIPTESRIIESSVGESEGEPAEPKCELTAPPRDVLYRVLEMAFPAWKLRRRNSRF